LPSVGVYLDEQPITTIQGALDLHLYDIERVEALAGPQGTLYGASSQAGTLRIITNKPDASKFTAGYALEANAISGDMGYVAEGFVNLPINDRTAVRLVGWDRHDGGYIDNVSRQRTYPTSGSVADSTPFANDNNNDVDVTGGRAALKIDLNDNWTITPQVMTQYTKANGNFSYDTTVGEMKVAKVRPEFSEDRFTQAALTVEGKIGNFDLIYAGAYLKRHDYTESDYSDYTYWYDTLLGYGAYWGDDPTQFIHGTDKYNRSTHELRISSDPKNRFRFVAGVFWQRQEHDIQQRYMINDLNPSYSITDWPDTIWLTKQLRVDKDSAIFGEMSFDITDHLTGTAGVRFFDSNNSLKGFFGYNDGYSGNPTYGEGYCSTQAAAAGAPLPTFEGAPCRVFKKTTKDNDYTPRVNLTYKFNDDMMVYATYAEGFRPGGINRRGTLPPYLSDWLKSYEVGWKTTLADNRVRFNGAVFDEKWDDFQFALLGLNGLTEITNAGQAEIKGVEMDLTWAATEGLSLSMAGSYLNAELTQNFCGFLNANGNPETHCDNPQAPDGTQLPVTPKWKGNATARYQFDLGNFNSFVQGSVIYVGEREADLRITADDDYGLYPDGVVPIRQILGKMPSYTSFDLSAGFGKESWKVELYATNAFDERGQVSRFVQCLEEICKDEVYVVPIAPRTIGLKFSQEF
jgi:Outer membrane receptor proteins, mostly Fe transport